MEKKNYKVVCSKLRFGNEVFVDIAPQGGVIHDQIFFSRAQLCKAYSNQPLERLANSIYLQAWEEDGQIERLKIDFPQVISEKLDKYEHERMLQLYAELEPQITAAYYEMRAGGRESTLFVYGVAEMNALQEAERRQNGSDADGDAFERREKRRRAQFAVKHTSPQTPQEEKLLKMAAAYVSECERRMCGEEKRAQETLPAWLRHQRQYDGD